MSLLVLTSENFLSGHRKCQRFAFFGDVFRVAAVRFPEACLESPRVLQNHAKVHVRFFTGAGLEALVLVTCSRRGVCN